MSDRISKLPALPTIYEILLIFLSSLCFINSYNGDFVFDDSPAIVNNPDVTKTSLSKIFFNDFWGNKLTHKQSHRSYRPLTILTFRFHHWLRGNLNPTDFHIINLILHSIISQLIYILFKKILSKKSKYLAFYGAVLFAVHPVHCEAVSGIVGRADLLSSLFICLSIFSYEKTIYCKCLYSMFLNLLICIILITIAMLCKEIGITAIGLCAAYEFVKIHEKYAENLPKIMKNIKSNNIKIIIVNNYKFIIRLITLIITGILLISIRFSLMGFLTPKFQKVDNPSSFLNNSLLRHVNYNYIYSLNLWLLICPEWLSFDWSMGCVPLINQFDKRLCAILLLWIFIGLIVNIIIKQFHHENSRYIFMGLCLLIIPFLPASNIFFNVGFVLAERTLYLPSAGYCLILIIGFKKLCEKIENNKIPLIMFIIIIIIWFGVSWKRSGEWKNEKKLFYSALNVCPLNAKVHYNVAKSAADSGNIYLAEFEYKEALRLHPLYAQAMNNLGNLLKDQGRYDDAEKLLRKAVKIQNDFPAAWMNLGIVLSTIKKFDESEECYRTSLFHRPKCPDCYYNLGILYMEQKEYLKAIEMWKKSISQKREHRRAWTNLIRLLDDIGFPQKGLDEGKKALKLFPEDSVIRLNIANILGKLEKFSEAENQFKIALKLNPKNPIIYTNLGVLYHRWNKYPAARKMYTKALELNPKSQSAKDNLKKLNNLFKKYKLKNF